MFLHSDSPMSGGNSAQAEDDVWDRTEGKNLERIR